MDPFAVPAYVVEAWLQSESTTEQPSWHKGEKLRRAVSSFHEEFARVPPRLDEARPVHTALIKQLFSHLNEKNIPVHQQYVGSAYEGVKVAKSVDNDDLEFDVLVTIKPPKGWKVHTENVPNRQGHVFLCISEGYTYPAGQTKTFFDNIVTPGIGRSANGADFKFFHVDGKKTIDKFFGELRNWIDLSSETKQKILLLRHGPAVQMDVYEHKINSGRPYYSVDVVPALEIEDSGEKKLYVAKPIKSRIMPDQFAWRRLDSIEIEFRGRYIDERVDRYTPTHAKYMLEIEKNLGHRYSFRFAGHRIGSSDDNLEFKVLVIDNSRKNQIGVSQITDKPDFFRLKQGMERLSSRRETTTLDNLLQQLAVSSVLLKGKVHVRREGSIVRLLVCEIIRDPTFMVESLTTQPLYYVDLMLAFEVSGSLYVARPKDGWHSVEVDNSKAWRRGFSTQEKAALYGTSCGCLKMVWRILKVLRNREVGLAPLTSYHLKTVFLWLACEHDPPDSRVCELKPYSWNEKYIGEILMKALLLLEIWLKGKDFPHFYLDRVNLTSHMVEDCINEIGCRINKLCTKEQEMMHVLEPTK